MFRLCRSRVTTSRLEEFTCPEFDAPRNRFALLALAPALIVSSALSALFGMG